MSRERYGNVRLTDLGQQGTFLLLRFLRNFGQRHWRIYRPALAIMYFETLIIHLTKFGTF